MAFKRRFRSRTGRFSRVRRRRPRTRRLIKFIKRTIKRSTEVKFSTTTATNQAIISGTWSLTQISPTISQGITRANRIGNRIQFKRCSVVIRLDALGIGGMAQSEQVSGYRIAIIQPRIEAMVIADVVQVTSFGAASIYTPLNTNSVRTIRDWKGIITNRSPVSSALQETFVPTSVFKRTVLRLPYKVNFKSDAVSTMSDPKDQTWILIGLEGNGTYNSGLANANFRYSFIDV